PSVSPHCLALPPCPPSFPTRRSSDLLRGVGVPPGVDVLYCLPENITVPRLRRRSCRSVGSTAEAAKNVVKIKRTIAASPIIAISIATVSVTAISLLSLAAAVWIPLWIAAVTVLVSLRASSGILLCLTLIFLRIIDHIVSFVDLIHLLCGIRVIGMQIRMVFFCHLPICLFYLFF